MKYVFGEYMIRDWREEDAKSIAQYANNWKIWVNLRDAFPHPYSLEDAEIFLSKVMDKEPRTYFAIATEQKAIGSIGLMPGEDVHRFAAELGYWLAEPFWNRGIATKAVCSLSMHAFEKLGFNRIFAEPYITNIASARVLEKAGFALEGILRASAIKNGKVLDQLLYSRINNEFRDRLTL